MTFFFIFQDKEKSGGKPEENGDRKTPNSDKSSRSSSPSPSTKSSSSAPSTPQENKVVTFPPPKVTDNSVRGKCREMIINSLKVEVEFEQSMQIFCFSVYSCDDIWNQSCMKWWMMLAVVKAITIDALTWRICWIYHLAIKSWVWLFESWLT